jgi:hypothetical protein
MSKTIPESILQKSNESVSRLLKISSEDPKTWDILAQKESVTLYKKRIHSDDSLDCARAITKLNKPIDRVKEYLFLSNVHDYNEIFTNFRTIQQI